MTLLLLLPITTLPWAIPAALAMTGRGEIPRSTSRDQGVGRAVYRLLAILHLWLTWRSVGLSITGQLRRLPCSCNNFRPAEQAFLLVSALWHITSLSSCNVT